MSGGGALSNAVARAIWPRRQAADAIDAGDTAVATRWFVDYWMGPGSWDRMPAAASMVNVRGWAGALFAEPRR